MRESEKPIVQIVSDDAMMRNNKFQLIESVVELWWKRIVIKFVYGFGVKKKRFLKVYVMGQRLKFLEEMVN